MFSVRRLRLLLQFLAGLAAVYGLSLLLSQAKDAITLAQLRDGWSILRPPHEVSALGLDGERLWAGGRDGLFLIDRRSGRLEALPAGTPPFSLVADLLIDREGGLWVASEEGASRYFEGRWSRLESSQGAPSAAARAFCLDASGQLWIGYETGVLHLAGTRTEFWDVDSPLGLPSVDVILQDRSGALWFGSASPTRGGLSRFDGATWTHFTSPDPLPHATVNALLEDRDGLIWVGTGFSRRGGASRYAAGKWTQLLLDDGLAGAKVRSLFEDSRGGLWIGSEYDGIAVFSGGRRQLITPEEGLAGWEVKEMVEDPDGVLWLGTEDGISRIESLDRVDRDSGRSS